MIVLLVLIAALGAWGVVATAVVVRNDGYRAVPTRRFSAVRPSRPAGAGR